MNHTNAARGQSTPGATVRPPRQQGFALVLALGLMGIFAILGTFYVRSMNLEWEAADYAMRQERARMTAEAGIYAALAEIESALAEDQLLQTLGTHTYTLPIYAAQQGAGEIGFAAHDSQVTAAVVDIVDESGRVNINHAPPSVLQAVLNVDGATARKITSSLPRPGEGPRAQGDPRGWFLNPEDLLTRGLLTADQYSALDPLLITTFSVADHANPVAYLNLNAAPAGVLAAVLDVPVEVADEVVAQRPFNTLAGLAKAAGKAPETFNIPPEPGAGDALPPALSFTSRCFRLISRAHVANLGPEGQEYARTSAEIEAVAVIADDGTFDFVYWSTTRN